VLNLCKFANLAYRQAASACEVLWDIFHIGEFTNGRSAPHATSIRLWMMRSGCAQIDSPILSDENEEWSILGDATVDIGTTKCFVTVGFPMNKWLQRENRTLSHDDIQLLGIYPTTECNGELVESACEDTYKKLSHKVCALLTDQGSDAKCGGTRFKLNHPEVNQVFDLPHKLSNLLKSELSGNLRFQEFLKKMNHTRQCIQQTELSPLIPPKQRSKARFMNVQTWIDWPLNLQYAKEAGHLSDISEERYKEYFGWICEFFPDIKVWKEKIRATEAIKDKVRKKGLSNSLSKELNALFLESPLAKDLTSEDRMDVMNFLGRALDCLLEETDKLDESMVVPGSTEVLESFFGKFKHVARYGGRGITGNVLRMANISGSNLSSGEIKEQLENYSVKKMKDWVANKIAKPLKSLGNRLKGQNLTEPEPSRT
jgi:hypothetical protein